MQHRNVVFRNCHLRGANDPYYSVYTDDEGYALTVERCDITRPVVVGDGFTGRANHVYAAEDGFCNDGYCFLASNVLLEDNLIDNMRGEPAANLDGIQVMGGSDIIIRSNWIETTSARIENGGVNAAIYIAPDVGAVSTVVVEHNADSGGRLLSAAHLRHRRNGGCAEQCMGRG